MVDDDFVSSAVRQLAVALLRQDADIQQGNVRSVILPPEELRHAWDQLCYACFSAGEVPPLNLQELVRWLHTPLQSWSLEMPDDWHKHALLDDGVPTAFCHTLGQEFIDAPDLRMEMQDAVFRELHAACRRLDDVSLYSGMREFLIAHPVLDDYMADLHSNPRWPPQVLEKLKKCFEPIPAEAIVKRDGQLQIARCPHCGWALGWRGDAAFCHKDGPCTAAVGVDLGYDAEWLPYNTAMYRTTEGIQRWVVAPEVELISARDDMAKAGISCVLFPHFDAYDMLIYVGGERWAVDLKDHKNPARLASNLRPFVTYPQWDRAFIAFPKHRVSNDYINRFTSHWHHRGRKERADSLHSIKRNALRKIAR